MQAMRPIDELERLRYNGRSLKGLTADAEREPGKICGKTIELLHDAVNPY